VVSHFSRSVKLSLRARAKQPGTLGRNFAPVAPSAPFPAFLKQPGRHDQNFTFPISLRVSPALYSHSKLAAQAHRRGRDASRTPRYVHIHATLILVAGAREATRHARPDLHTRPSHPLIVNLRGHARSNPARLAGTSHLSRPSPLLPRFRSNLVGTTRTSRSHFTPSFPPSTRSKLTVQAHRRGRDTSRSPRCVHILIGYSLIFSWRARANARHARPELHTRRPSTSCNFTHAVASPAHAGAPPTGARTSG